MNKTVKIWVALALAATITLCGCEPEDPIIPEKETIENVFADSMWECNLQNSVMEEGVLINVSLAMTLDFCDTVHAIMISDLYYDIPAIPLVEGEYSESPYTYSFTKDSVFLHEWYVDEETGDTINETTALAYDKEAQTLTWDINDAEVEQILGVSSFVFVPYLRTDPSRPKSHNTSNKGIKDNITYLRDEILAK